MKVLAHVLYQILISYQEQILIILHSWACWILCHMVTNGNLLLVMFLISWETMDLQTKQICTALTLYLSQHQHCHYQLGILKFCYVLQEQHNHISLHMLQWTWIRDKSTTIRCWVQVLKIHWRIISIILSAWLWWLINLFIHPTAAKAPPTKTKISLPTDTQNTKYVSILLSQFAWIMKTVRKILQLQDIPRLPRVWIIILFVNACLDFLLFFSII